MKNEEKVERDKEAIDDQLDQKISEGVFSGLFHTIAVGIGDISRWQRLVRPNRSQVFAEEFRRSLLELLSQDRIRHRMGCTTQGEKFKRTASPLKLVD